MDLVFSSPKSRVISSQAELHPAAQTPFQQINKMVVVPTKMLLSWYLITLKLRETIHARQKGLRLPILSPKWGSFERPQQQKFAPLGALVKRIAENHDIEPHPLEDTWLISFKKELAVANQDYEAVSRKDVTVYRVPGYLKDPSRTKDYTPRVVSLGPYHHGMAPLQKMEQHKRRILQHALKRNKQDIELFIDSMRKLENRARACYEEQSELSSHKFVEMMLLDGFFILEILRGSAYGQRKFGYYKNDPIFSMLGAINFIQLDMIMVENQFPLFVLDKLYELQPKFRDEELSVFQLVDKLFDGLMPSTAMATEGLHCLDVVREKILNGATVQDIEDEARHKLKDMFRKGIDVVRKKILNRVPEVEREGKKHERLNYCATELKNAGIKLWKGDTNNSLLKIEFKNGILYIPQIRIDDGFKSLFSNLIAFEQCHLDSEQQHIASYVAFLDELVDSPEDVRYLKNHEIIMHMVGSDAEVAGIINSLCHEVVSVIEDSYLSHLSSQINNYRNQKWNIWQATLKERYFNNPWAIISFVAAGLLLIMTAAQTFYGVYSYYLPNN